MGDFSPFMVRVVRSFIEASRAVKFVSMREALGVRDILNTVNMLVACSDFVIAETRIPSAVMVPMLKQVIFELFRNRRIFWSFRLSLTNIHLT